MELDRQPVGAGGEALGVMVLVMLKITIDGASTPFYVACYVLQSCKPLWKGKLYDCALVLGTNALETMGFRITHPNGKSVDSAGKCQLMRTAKPEPKSDAEVHVVLSQQLCLGPFQSKTVKASTSSVNSDQDLRVKLVNPNNNLANRQCDFTEKVWEGKSTGELRITNWSGEPLSLKPGEVIGNVEEVSRVSLDDPVWSNTEVTVAQISQLSDEEITESKLQLEAQLVIGNSCLNEDQSKFKELLLSKHDSFTVKDSELGETDVVEHGIDTGKAKPVKTFP